MSESPAPDAISFRLSRDKPMKNLVLSVVVLVGVAIWVAIERDGEGFLMFLGIGLVLFAYWHWQSSREQAAADFDRTPKLVIDAEGLTIPDRFTTKAPWTSIQSLSLTGDKHGDYVALVVDDPERFGFEPHAGTRLARMIGDHTIHFDYAPLECDTAQLREALLRHAPARLADRL